LDELSNFLYAVPSMVCPDMDDKTRKAAQGKFFKNVYQLILGQDKGPRLYLFLFAVDLERFIDLLTFEGGATL
ncbi:MAG: hypothetical protein RR209_01665, partial [Angelakisella sp.]